VQVIGTTASATRGVGPTAIVLVLAALIGVWMAVAGPVVVAPFFGLLLVVAIVARPEYGIALFLSTFLMNYPQALQGSGFLTINNVLGGIFLVLLVYKVYREEDFWFLRCPEIHLLGFVIVAFYVSAQLNGPDPRLVALLGAQERGGPGLRLFLNRAAFTLFFINFIRTAEHVRMIYVLALAFMVVSALTGMQSVLRGGGIYGGRATAEASLIAAALNPNRLAMFSILAIAGLWYLMQSMRIPALRVMIVPTVVVLALTVLMTASRSGLLGLGVAVVAILWDQRVSLMGLLSLSLAAVMLLLLATQFVPQRSMERLLNLPGTEAAATGEGAGSLERRQYTWEVALNIARESPFLGVGMGNWELVRFLRDPTRSTAAPHSSYLLAMVEGGVFCLGGFLVLLWRTWRNLKISEHYLRDPAFPLADLLWIVKGAKVSFLVLIFFSLFADLWQLIILFWLVALGIVIRRLTEQAAFEQSLAA